jgi:hypothetical protein
MRKWRVWKDAFGCWVATSSAGLPSFWDTWQEAYAHAYWHAVHELSEVP